MNFRLNVIKNTQTIIFMHYNSFKSFGGKEMRLLCWCVMALSIAKNASLLFNTFCWCVVGIERIVFHPKKFIFWRFIKNFHAETSCQQLNSCCQEYVVETPAYDGLGMEICNAKSRNWKKNYREEIKLFFWI